GPAGGSGGSGGGGGLGGDRGGALGAACGTSSAAGAALLLTAFGRALLDDGLLLGQGCGELRLLERRRLAGRLLGLRRRLLLTGPPATTVRPAAAHGTETLAVGPPPPLTLAETFARPTAPAAARLILVAEPQLSIGSDALVALRHDLALVDPHLDADPAEGRLGLGEPVVDVGSNRVERDAPLGIGLGAAHLRTA